MDNCLKLSNTNQAFQLANKIYSDLNVRQKRKMKLLQNFDKFQINDKCQFKLQNEILKLNFGEIKNE